MLTRTSNLVGITLLSLGLACSSSKIEGSGSNSNNSGGGAGSGGGRDTSMLVGTSTAVTTNTGTTSQTKGTRCDDKGNCYCIAIASIGQPAAYGADSGSSDNQNAFQEYLNTKSNATVKMFTTKPTFNADFLKDYDLIVLQAMVNGSLKGGAVPWTIGDDEVKAVEEWVKAGHSIISMSGYQGDSAEVNPLNKLLGFTGITYNTDDIYTNGDRWDYCRDSSVPFNGWKSPMDFGGMKAVGVFHGRSLKCGDCKVWAEDAGGMKMGVEKDVGSGRVFAFADEWVTYTSQWGLVTKDRGTDCVGHTATEMYTVPQFWYNAIANVISDELKKCFKIEDVIVY
jgi:hypothetical protein